MQVKGFMPLKRHKPKKLPPAEPLGRICHDITIPSFLYFLCHQNRFVYSAIFSAMIFVGFCEWIDFALFDIVGTRDYHLGWEVKTIMDTDFTQLLFMHLEEREHNNVYQNLQQDIDYLETTAEEATLCEQYENLDLSEEQRTVIKQWIASIHAQNAAYTAVVFRMAMQCCFSMLMQLADLK